MPLKSDNVLLMINESICQPVYCELNGPCRGYILSLHFTRDNQRLLHSARIIFEKAVYMLKLANAACEPGCSTLF